MKLNEINIYRLTHINNIKHILNYGITHSGSQNKNSNYVNIGDVSLINTRKDKKVIVDNGLHDSNQNKKTITLGDFIPFYFGGRMPMLYVAQVGGNFVEKATKPEDIVYIACSFEKLLTENIDFYYSDGHATDILTSFYDKSQIENLNNILDWNAIKSKYWGGHENLDIKRKKQAEVLVSEDLSPDYIVGAGCYNNHVKEKLVSLGIDNQIIKIIPQAYF
jgi:hypothetical protein